MFCKGYAKMLEQRYLINFTGSKIKKNAESQKLPGHVVHAFVPKHVCTRLIKALPVNVLANCHESMH